MACGDTGYRPSGFRSLCIVSEVVCVILSCNRVSCISICGNGSSQSNWSQPRSEKGGSCVVTLSHSFCRFVRMSALHSVVLRLPNPTSAPVSRPQSPPTFLYCRGLDKNSSLTRGVGLMWRNALNANFISCISSDQICGIRVKLSSSEPAELTILRVYLPCADLGLETYCKHLESLISEGQKPGPVLIAGDLNAHRSWVHWVVSEDKASPTCRESSQSSSLTDVSYTCRVPLLSV